MALVYGYGDPFSGIGPGFAGGTAIARGMYGGVIAVPILRKNGKIAYGSYGEQVVTVPAAPSGAVVTGTDNGTRFIGKIDPNTFFSQFASYIPYLQRSSTDDVASTYVAPAPQTSMAGPIIAGVAVLGALAVGVALIAKKR